MSVRNSSREELHALSGLVYDSVTTGVNPITSEAFANVASELPTITQRMTARALRLAISHGFEKQLQRLATRAYKDGPVVGIGRQSVVLADGEGGVRKILHRTHSLSEEKQAARIARMEERQTRLAEGFADRMLLQRFVIEPFPLNPAFNCIVAYQRRVREGTPSTPIKASPTMHDFLADCRTFYDQTGVIPDIVSPGNMFETSAGIVIVDTLPFLADAPAHRQGLVLAGQVLAMHELGDGFRIPDTNSPVMTPAV